MEFDAAARSLPRRRQPFPKIAVIVLCRSPRGAMLAINRGLERAPQARIVYSRKVPPQPGDAGRIVLVDNRVAELGAGLRKKCEFCRIRARSEPVHCNSDGLHSGKIGLIERYCEPQDGQQPLSHLLGCPFSARHHHQAVISCRSEADGNQPAWAARRRLAVSPNGPIMRSAYRALIWATTAATSARV